MILFKKAESDQEFELGKHLFQAYAKELALDLDFQNFAKELEDIKIQYHEPQGMLLIAYAEDNQAIGCFGIRKFSEEVCELKRMYIDPQFRGRGIGQQMMKEAIKTGGELGYVAMRLDTLASMTPAMELYKKNGFYEIPAYRFNPFPGAVYFERKLI